MLSSNLMKARYTLVLGWMIGPLNLNRAKEGGGKKILILVMQI